LKKNQAANPVILQGGAGAASAHKTCGSFG
jgi:hypothetical protein